MAAPGARLPTRSAAAPTAVRPVVGRARLPAEGSRERLVLHARRAARRERDSGIDPRPLAVDVGGGLPAHRGRDQPWAAHELEFAAGKFPLFGLWTQPEAAFVTSLKKGGGAVLWGCDIEEVQPHLLIRDLAALNPRDEHLRSAVAGRRRCFQRRTAPTLLQHVGRRGGQGPVVQRRLASEQSAPDAGGRDRQGGWRRAAGIPPSGSGDERPVPSAVAGGHRQTQGFPPLRQEPSPSRLRPARVCPRWGTSWPNWPPLNGCRPSMSPRSRAAAALRWRGRRPSSTSAATTGIRLPGVNRAVSGDSLRSPPLRQPLHRIPGARRSSLEASLVYWADSYDAIIFYRRGHAPGAIS